MTDKEKLKNLLYNKHCIADYKEENPLVALYLDDLVDLVDNYKEEPVSEDLSDYINELSKQFQEVSFAKLSRIAVRVAKWQRKQIIDKACEWLDGAIPDYIELKHANIDTFINIDNKKFVEDFCKAMED